jgi:kinetochore protein Nuf2
VRVLVADGRRYLVKAKERGVWQKERDQLLLEQKALEEEMSVFVAKHEGEINELLQEYWTMRRQAGESA